MLKQRIIEELTGKSILILGFGREGKSTYNFIKQNKIRCTIGIADKLELDLSDIDKNIKVYTGENYLDSINNYDIVIKSPGISFKGKDYSKFKNKITSQTELFLKYASDKIIGITGTKGKSTTASLIYDILKMKYKTKLVGNIGVPVLEMIDFYNDTDWYVCELSSHQLEHVKYSPHISILLNMYQEHLDHYNSYDEYKEAKRNIYKYQKPNDYYIYNYNMEKILNTEYSFNQNLVKISDHEIECANYLFVKNRTIIANFNHIKEFVDIPSETKLIGKHNLYNIAVAIAVALILKVDKKSIINAIKNFKSLPHRLEFIGRFNDIDFIDDSIATIPEATISAANSIDNIDTLLIGGMDRGVNYNSLIEYILSGKINNIILMYESGKRIFDEIKQYNSKFNTIYAKNLEEAVKIALNVTTKNKACVLSPAAASYGVFKNFEERGNKFKELVIKYAKLEAKE